MSITSILHVASRCGGGKSHHTISELYKSIQKSVHTGEDPILYIIASKTNDLSQQNYSNFCSYIQSEHAEVNASLIDSNESKNVTKDIYNYLVDNNSGVLFISHSALSRIDSNLLKGVYLICDEVPTDLVKPIRVQNEDKDSGAVWERFLVKTNSKHQGYRLVTIDPTADTKNIERLIENVREGRDNTLTREVTDLLEYLLDGHEALYSTQKKYDKKTMDIYRGINWKPLGDIQKTVTKFAVLSAQLEDTLFGFTAKHIAGLSISNVSVIDTLKLETKHRNRARIYPLLKERQWSKYLKNEIASESIVDHNHTIRTGATVIEHFQSIVHQKLAGKEFLLFLNKSDKTIPELESSNVTLLTIATHGINSYSHINHAAYLASSRPDPIEEASLSIFAEDHNLNKEDILKAVITERCYETSYQCIARTSIRLPVPKEEIEHIFFVPDMEYANYLKNWFIQGKATIDTSLACDINPSPSLNAREKKQRGMLIRILRDLPHMKLKDLLIRENICKRTYLRYRKKFNL